MKDILFYLFRGKMSIKEAKQLAFAIITIIFVIGCVGNPLACQTTSEPKIIYIEGDGGKSMQPDTDAESDSDSDVQEDCNQD